MHHEGAGKSLYTVAVYADICTIIFRGYRDNHIILDKSFDPNGSIELVSIRLFTMPVEITGLRLFHVVKSFAAND